VLRRGGSQSLPSSALTARRTDVQSTACLLCHVFTLFDAGSPHRTPRVPLRMRHERSHATWQLSTSTRSRNTFGDQGYIAWNMCQRSQDRVSPDGKDVQPRCEQAAVKSVDSTRASPQPAQLVAWWSIPSATGPLGRDCAPWRRVSHIGRESARPLVHASHRTRSTDALSGRGPSLGSRGDRGGAWGSTPRARRGRSCASWRVASDTTRRRNR